MLSQYGKLSIAIIAYYVLALPIAVWICIRHGFGRHAGWFYLLSLAIVRIAGASLRIARRRAPQQGAQHRRLRHVRHRPGPAAAGAPGLDQASVQLPFHVRFTAEH